MLVVQSRLTFCNPVDCSLPGSSIHGTLQARILEQVAILFSSESSLPRDWTRSSHIAGRFFIAWATRESHSFHISKPLLRSSPLFEILSLSLGIYFIFTHQGIFLDYSIFKSYLFMSTLINRKRTIFSWYASDSYFTNECRYSFPFCFLPH